MSATTITPEYIKKFIVEFNCKYMKQFLSNLLANQCQSELSVLTEKLAKYEKAFPSPTYAELEYLHILNRFEKLQKLAEKISFPDQSIMKEDILKRVETLRAKYENPSLLHDRVLKDPIATDIVTAVLETTNMNDKNTCCTTTAVSFSTDGDVEMKGGGGVEEEKVNKEEEEKMNE